MCFFESKTLKARLWINIIEWTETNKGGWCVYGCKTNYDSNQRKKKEAGKKKKFVHSFPKDETDNEKWKNAVPIFNANLIVKNDTVVCELHLKK